MPFRTMDSDPDQQARRDAARRQIEAGERLRAEVDQRRRVIAEGMPAYLAEARGKRCSTRLDSAVDPSGYGAAGFLAAMFGGPVIGLGVVVHALIDGGSWLHLLVGIAALALAVLVVRGSLHRSALRLAGFRLRLRALPFQSAGIEETLGQVGVLSEMTIRITPVHELPIEAVANLVALIAPEVRVDDQSSKTSVTHVGTQVLVTRRFETYPSEDGSQNERDDAAPVVWIFAMLDTMLCPLHELHALARIEVG
jgi:hypothetical protein